jgi:hypothetical protein
MKKIMHVLRFFHPVLFYRRFRYGAYLASCIRRYEGRAPTDAEYQAIADEVERRIP